MSFFADHWDFVLAVLALIAGLAWIIVLLERDHKEAEEAEKDWWPK